MSHSLTNNLYSGDQTRELDRRAIQEQGIPGAVLMKRAGRAAFEYACSVWPQNRRWLVLCGGGNNAGDGYVFAALAAQRQHEVAILFTSPPEQLKGDARAAYEYARQEGVSIQPFFADASPFEDDLVIVDALLGIGLRSPVREDTAAAIRWINSTGAPVLALDLPSGLCADAGAELGIAVRATHTITFIAAKTGLFTGRGPALCGRVEVAGLGVAEEAFTDLPPTATKIELPELLPLLPERAADAHKGQFGHVMVIGGELGYGGAAILAAETASMTGAGLISLATRAEHVAAALVRRPELMVIGVPSGQELEPYLARPTVLVVGPGLGRTPWSEQLLQQALQSNLPLVLDADALNILAAGKLVASGSRRNNWLLTPHPGEAARLLGVNTQDVQADRYTFVQSLQQRYGGAVILKGAGSLVADEQDEIGVSIHGNPGMATGGMGDVLAGILGALLAQGLSLSQAARLGACLHGAAADLAADDLGQRSLLATDLMPYLCELLSD